MEFSDFKKKALNLLQLGGVPPIFSVLPPDETLIREIYCEFEIPGSQPYSGRLFVSQTFIIFESNDHFRCRFVIPLYAITRLDKLNSYALLYIISVTTIHDTVLHIKLLASRKKSEEVCDKLRVQLKAQGPNRKRLKPFLTTFISEFLVSDNLTEYKCYGLGRTFGYPGNAKKDRQKAKHRLWTNYLKENGKNITVVQYPSFFRLVRVGLPNALRGEIWEIISGSAFLRWNHIGEYERVLNERKGETSLSLEEIEKDLNRSLPEYEAYQTSAGIDALRRVLSAFSWKNSDVGYCQAMNIVVAALLIYCTEEQTFWLLTSLCQRYIHGYYSTTMYGTLLDQKVFEALVPKTLPVIWEKLMRHDIQLSIVSLPWFLSLFINSMPLQYAMRIFDCFIMEGPRVLFQIGLAILKINGEAILEITDDAAFMEVIKGYLASLDETQKYAQREVTKFQILLGVAFREFCDITTDTIEWQRKKLKDDVLQNIEKFAKHTQLRSFKDKTSLPYEALDALYDRYYGSLSNKRMGYGEQLSRMDETLFFEFFSNIFPWAKMDDRDIKRKNQQTIIRKLFRRWDKDTKGYIDFSDVVAGIGEILKRDLMGTISMFFEMHDEDHDWQMRREEILELAENLLFITRGTGEIDEGYLPAISRFIKNCFEHALKKPLHQLVDNEADQELLKNTALDPSVEVYLNLPTFRMVVLAEEALEELFAGGFADSLDLSIGKSEAGPRGLRGMFDLLLSDGIWAPDQRNKDQDQHKKIIANRESLLAEEKHTSNKQVEFGKVEIQESAFAIGSDDDDDGQDDEYLANELMEDVSLASNNNCNTANCQQIK